MGRLYPDHGADQGRVRCRSRLGHQRVPNSVWCRWVQCHNKVSSRLCLFSLRMCCAVNTAHRVNDTRTTDRSSTTHQITLDPPPRLLLTLTTPRSRNESDRHSRTHSDERPFECRQCHKGFKRSSCLKRHEAVHKPIKPFWCTVSACACAWHAALQPHMVSVCFEGCIC